MSSRPRPTIPYLPHPPSLRFSLAVLLILSIGLLHLGSYLTTLTEVHTFDALSYVLDVDRKPWQELFHPHHIAYGPLGAAIRTLSHALGWQGSALVPLQVVNAVVGAVGVSCFCALIYHATRRLDLVLCGGLLLGSSYAYWYYAVEVEVYTIAALFLILCLWLMVSIAQQPTLPARRPLILLGVAQGMAILFHQTNVLLSLPIGILLLCCFFSRRPPTYRPTFLAGAMFGWYLLPLGLMSAGSYLLVGFGFSDFGSWGEMWAWMTDYAQTGWWGGAVTHDSWADLGKGIAETIAQPFGAALGMLLLSLVLLFLPKLITRHGLLLIPLTAWLLTYGIFFFWWEPDNIEFWIASLPPALFIFILALEAGGRPWYTGVWATLVIGAAIWMFNHGSITLRGDSTQDDHRTIVHLLAEYSTPDDLLLVSDGLQELYLPFYEDHNNTWSINQAMWESATDWEQACERLQQRIDHALGRGLAVFLGQEVLFPQWEDTTFGDPILQRFGLAQEQVTQCFAPYLPDIELVDMDDDLPPFYRIPTAQEMVEERGGWSFTRHRWGWHAAHIREERFADAWYFTPDVDPNLVSPPISVAVEDYDAIEIRFGVSAATTATMKYELFFVDEQGLVHNEHVVQRTVERDEEQPHTYHISLEDREGWEGTMTGLRFDPVGEGDGGVVWVEWVRFISAADE